jgi:hypothetical protein
VPIKNYGSSVDTGRRAAVKKREEAGTDGAWLRGNWTR